MAEVLRLWVRPAEGAPLEERSELELVAGKGIVGEHAFGRMRHVTLVFAGDWRRAEAALGQAVDPSARRANVLVSGGGGAELVKQLLRIGGALIAVKGIVAPCPVMERGAAGLRAALKPEGRSGIWARVVAGGRVRLGDPVRVEAAPTLFPE